MSTILAAILDFSKILFSGKMQQMLLKLVENMRLQPQIRMKLRIKWTKEKVKQIVWNN